MLIITNQNNLIAKNNPYENLPIQEQQLIKKALEESKYYKYYESLAKGEDKVKVLKITKISESIIGSSLDNKYTIQIDLIIKDKHFIRKFDLDLGASSQEEKSWIDDIKDYVIYLAIFLGGVGLGALAK